MVGVAVPLEPGASRLWRYGVAATMFSALVMGALVFYSRGLGRIEGYMPRGECYLWQPPLVLLHAVSDAAIAAAFVSISVTLAYLVRGARPDIPFDWMILAFGGFIIACGVTHAMEVWTLWRANYWFSGGIKLFTAAVSVITAIALPPLVPRIQALVRADSLARDRELRLAEERAVPRGDRDGACGGRGSRPAKDEFLATLAHELRNPLAPIRTSARSSCAGWTIAHRTAVEPSRSSSGRRSDARPLDRRSARRVAHLARQGRAAAASPSCSPTWCATCSMRGARARARPSGQELRVGSPRQTVPLFADPGALVAGACRTCSPTRSSTRRAADRSSSWSISRRRRRRVRVPDDGIGIPSRALPHIFDRFWQADGSRERAATGAGTRTRDRPTRDRAARWHRLGAQRRRGSRDVVHGHASALHHRRVRADAPRSLRQCASSAVPAISQARRATGTWWSTTIPTPASC